MILKNLAYKASSGTMELMTLGCPTTEMAVVQTVSAQYLSLYPYCLEEKVPEYSVVVRGAVHHRLLAIIQIIPQPGQLCTCSLPQLDQVICGFNIK